MPTHIAPRRSGIRRVMDRMLSLAEHTGNRWFRPLGTALFRARRGRIGPPDRTIILLTTRGRRSGRIHTVLLQAFPDNDDLILVAANAGRSTHPDWYLNLFSAGSAEVEVRGERYPVRPEHVPATEAVDWWPRILARAPTYERYRQSTTREIPLARLVREAPTTQGASPGF